MVLLSIFFHLAADQFLIVCHELNEKTAFFLAMLYSLGISTEKGMNRYKVLW